MGSATIDPHSHKVQTKLDKIPKFGVNRPPGGALPYKRLLGMCRWMGSHFHD